MDPIPLFPEAASTIAGSVDRLYFFLVGVSLFFIVLIFVLIAWLSMRYRVRPGRKREQPGKPLIWLEIAWSAVPLILALVMFFWGANIFIRMYGTPQAANAMEIFVVARQWMWKFQHPTGQLEIDELHLPNGRPIKLTLISEDAIHSLFVPAFRIKRDVLPGRYISVSFEATKPGRYRLFCAEYCGMGHSQMTGWVEVMNPADFQEWLGRNSTAVSMELAGERLFQQLGCQTCHGTADNPRGPALHGLPGRQVTLATREVVMASDDYLRESIVRPSAKIVAGYAPIMPSFQGQIDDRQILQLIAYLRSLGAPGHEAKEP